MNKVTEPIADTWYYIVVQDPETPDEQVLGYTEQETGETFVPAFKTKETAQQCFLIMPKDLMKHKFEAQAIIKEDLVTHAAIKGSRVFLLDDKGRVLEKII